MPSVKFTALLFRTEGPGGWTFAEIPESLRPTNRLAWGMTPVLVRVGGREARTSVWTEKDGRALLPLSKKLRAGLEAGDSAQIELEYEF